MYLFKRALSPLLVILTCCSCAGMQMQPNAQARHEAVYCHGSSMESAHCRKVDVRALQRAIFGLPGHRR